MYLINLDRRVDRLNTTSFLLDKNGYKDIIRFSAIDGSKLSNEQLNTLVHKDSLNPIIQGQRTQHHELSKGAVGCYLSHVGVWNHALNNKNDSIIVFEDDTKPSLTKTQLNTILLDCPENWDIILFGGQYTPSDPTNNNTNNKFIQVNKFYCLHAYMINKRGIDKIRPHLFPIRMQIDSALSQIPNLNIYAIKQTGWYQNIEVGKTDIQTPIVVS